MKEQIINYYNQLAPEYDQDRFGHTYGQFIDSREKAILTHLLGPAEQVIDLACGTGRLSHFATMGVDASQNMLDIATRKHPGKAFLCHEASALPFQSASIDVIFSFHFFMHLNHVDADAVIRECHRVLRPGGRLIFDIPSDKRRQLLRQKNGGWHGAFSMNLAEIDRMAQGFTRKRTFGLLFFPIHRISARWRKLFQRPDAWLGRSWLKSYSSYLIIELVKQ